LNARGTANVVAGHERVRACIARAMIDARLRESRLWLVRNTKIAYMIDAATSMKEIVHACQ